MNCSDVRHSHVITLHPGGNSTAQKLLSQPESEAGELECPVCEYKVKMFEPLSKLLKEFAEALGGEDKPLQLLITHPFDLPETKTLPADSFWEVERYARFEPTVIPTNPLPEDLECYVVLWDKGHKVLLKPSQAGFLVKDVLNQPEAKAKELDCPVCEVKLGVVEPLAELIQFLQERANSKFIAWTISHPANLPKTKAARPNAPIKTAHHSPSTETIISSLETYPVIHISKKDEA